MPDSPKPLWHQLNPAALERPTSESVGDVSVHFYLSPYDLPEAVRGKYEPSEGLFSIQFRYLDEEKPVRAPYGDLVLSIGKNSHRLLGIEVKVDKVRNSPQAMQQLEAIIQKAIEAFARSSTGTRQENYQVAKEVIKNNRGVIFSAVPNLVGAR